MYMVGDAATAGRSCAPKEEARLACARREERATALEHREQERGRYEVQTTREA